MMRTQQVRFPDAFIVSSPGLPYLGIIMENGATRQPNAARERPLPSQTRCVLSPQSRSQVSPSLAFLAVRVFLPFGLGYFLSQLYRTVNAVLGPMLRDELGISASSLGLLTGAFFLAFALVQMPLGMALDRYGPRRTQAVLLTVTAIGAVLFSLGGDTLSLALARAVIGVGVSGCLLASFKAFALWFEKGRLPLVNGLVMACGSLGVMTASTPVQALATALGWREVFHILAAISIVVAIVIFLVVPEKHVEGEPRTLADQIAGLKAIFGSPVFWSIAPLLATAQSAWLSIQALWLGPWLRDMAGLDAGAAAHALLLGGLGGATGYILLGGLTERLGRLGVPVGAVAGSAVLVFIAVQGSLALGIDLPPWALTFAFAFFGGGATLFYAGLTQRFPVALAGRVNTSLALFVFSLAFALQVVTGLVLDLFPDSSGGYTAAGYRVAFGGWALVQIACFLWFLLRYPRRPAG